MSTVQKIDRTVVAIFDIEGFSKNSPNEQVAAVKHFVDHLDAELKARSHLKADAFSTGDGAIVSIGREERITHDSVNDFFEFIVEFVVSAHNEGLILRTAVHYSEGDSVVVVQESTALVGKYIQIGDTINLAARIITYCEPKEILVSRDFIGLLRLMGLEKRHHFFENEPFVTKHGEVLRTFTFVAEGDEGTLLYQPSSPMHPYKKYNYFPPISSATLDYFMKIGMEHELRNLISHSYETIKEVNNTRNIISHHDIVDVLSNLNCEPEEEILVLSRNDRMHNFWTHPRKSTYLTFLESQKRCSKGFLNHKRLMIFGSGGEIVGKEDIFHNLIEMHQVKTFFSLPAFRLIRYPHLNELLFGATISKKHRYVIIAVPAGVSMEEITPDLSNIGFILAKYNDYDVVDGPLKALITANARYVETLIQEFEAIVGDPGENLKEILK